MIFATDKNQDSDFYLKGDPISLIATNVPSFMGGKANPWFDANKMQLESTKADKITVENYGVTTT